MLSCSDFLARHSEYLDGLMEADASAQWRTHTAECADCARYDRVVRRGLKVVAGQTEIEPSVDFMIKLEQRLAEEDRRTAMRPMTSLAGASVAVAAMLAFAAWVPVLMFSTEGERAVVAGAEAPTASAAASEIAWHVEEAVERRTPAHIHLARRVAWAPTSTGHVIEPKYSPVVLQSPIAPLAYSRTHYGSE